MRSVEGYTVREDGVYFLMQDGPIGVVCEITLEALSRLGQASGLTEPTEIFKTTRDAIERVVSDKYDRTPRRAYEIVTITADDVDAL
jgi:Protein of unknown function (DUF1488)